MLGYAYIRPFMEYQLEPGETWRVLFAYEGESLVGVLPLILTQEKLLGAARRCLRSPSSPHITSVTIVTSPGYEDRVTRFFLAELARTEPEYFSFSCERLHCATSILPVLEQTIDEVNVIVEPASKGSFLPITGNFQAYRATLGHNFRRNLRRWEKRLAKLGGSRALFLSGKDASADCLEQFLQIEASGWKGRQGSAILSAPRRAEFYRALVEELRRAGWLELHVLKSGDHIIAGHLAMRMQRTLVVWKIAYDETFAACAPGNILFEKTIERAFLTRDIDEINCLTDMQWHRNWRMEQRPYYNLFLYPRRTFPYVLGIMPRRALNLFRNLPGLRPLVNSVRGLLS